MRPWAKTALIILTLVPATLLSQFLPARRSDNYDPSTRDGRFDLRVRAGGAVDFLIRGDRIRYKVRRGAAPIDEGSEYRKELPVGEQLIGLKLEQRDGRTPIRIVEEPSARNQWSLVLRIEDSRGGTDRYHARITWEDSAPPPGSRSAAPASPRAGGARRAAGRVFGLPTGSFEPFRSDNYRPNSRAGRFDLRARVDGDAEFLIRHNTVSYRVLEGGEPANEGCEYNAELPLGEVIGLKLEQRDGRNPIQIVEQPSRRNNWTLILRITDGQPGSGRYHARITWRDSRPY